MTSDNVLDTNWPLHHTTVVHTTIKSSINKKEKSKKVFPTIRSFSDFVYGDSSFTLRKFAGFGTGIDFSYDKFSSVKSTEIEVISAQPSDLSQLELIAEKNNLKNGINGKFWSIIKVQTTKNEEEKEETNFDCPDEMCEASFEKSEDLEEHLQNGEHRYNLAEKLNVVDSAVLQFCEAINGQFLCGSTFQHNTPRQDGSETEVKIEAALLEDFVAPETLTQYPVGWAHRVYKTKQTFKIEVKNLLRQYYDEGKSNKANKVSPVEARNRLMALIRGRNANFGANDVPKALQIQSIFQSFILKDKKDETKKNEPEEKKLKIEEKNEDEEEKEEEKEDELEEADDEEDANYIRLKKGAEELLKRQRDTEVIKIIEGAVQEGEAINNEDDN